jgi:hypothetical protein
MMLKERPTVSSFLRLPGQGRYSAVLELVEQAQAETAMRNAADKSRMSAYSDRMVGVRKSPGS